MQPRKSIGVRVDDFGMDVKSGLSCAARQRFSAVEVTVDREESSPEQMSESGRRHLARLIRSAGMDFASLAANDTGGRLADPTSVDRLIGRTAATLKMAADMHVPVVSQDVGELLDLSDSARAVVTEALEALADTAERVGTIYAVRSRLCRPEDLGKLIATVACPQVRISCDPGALLMAGYDPVDALAAYGDHLVLAYVRDALRGAPDRPGYETALGRGGLDLDAYLAGLAACDCRGPRILRRAHAVDSPRELAADKAFLEARLPI